MSKNNQEMKLTDRINSLIEINQDSILSYFENRLIEYRKLFSQELFDPRFLCFVVSLKIIEKEDLGCNTKTILRFEKATSYIYYNSKLNNYELNFCLMK